MVEIYSLMLMVAGVTANCGPFCSKDFSSGVSSFLERLIILLSWIIEEVEEVNAVLKALIVLEAILEVVVEDLEMRCLSFLIWVFLYCRNVFSLLLKMVFCRLVKVGSSSFCCRDDLVVANNYTNKPIHTSITKAEHLALENLRKDKDCIIVTADKGVALDVMDKTILHKM